MKPIGILACAAFILIACGSWAFADGGRIYGRITTVDGDVYEGLIRWDKNEASWCDILNGDKDPHRGSPRKHYRERHEKISVLGITIGERFSSRDSGGGAQSGISFGHIKSLEAAGEDAVRLTLKSGEKLVLEGGSSDIGSDIREIVIEDAKEGEVEFDWSDIKTIEFTQAKTTSTSSFGERLYGTLTTRRGDTYTGWVSWDVDELFSGDVIDGKQRNRNRKIAFDKIKSIERNNSRSATITLASGDEIALHGTNDVDDSSRGIAIYDPGLGQIAVDWNEFRSIAFTAAPRSLAYADFDGGARLEGTVYTETGEKHTGMIRWDDDEEYTWEILDGTCRGATFDVAFGMIKEIKPQGRRGALVTTRDGRSFRLKGTNDVSEDNRGIFISTNAGKEIEVSWDELDRVEFAR